MPLLPSAFDHGGHLRAASEKYRIPAKRIMDFSANINPLGLPSRIKRLVRHHLDTLERYPDPECKALKNEMARMLPLPPDNILIGNGSVDLIYLICHALRPPSVLIPVPTFSEYERAARAARAQCIFTPAKAEEDFRVDLKKCLPLLPQVGLVFLCNPGNPTGHLIQKADLMSFVEQCQRHNVFMVLDEAFMDFVDNGEAITLIAEVQRQKNLIVLRSLTKFFALPGLRIGYMAARSELIQRIRPSQAPWSVNALAQLAGREALKDRVYIRRSQEYIWKERQRLYQALKKINGLHPYRPTANFIFCQLASDKINSTELCHALGAQGYLVRDGASFRGLNPRFIRIAVRKRPENRALIKALQEVLEDGK